MFEKYIMIKDNKILCGQTSGGIWYCKELPANDMRELNFLIGETNKILNKYNNEVKVPSTPPQKNKKPMVRM